MRLKLVPRAEPLQSMRVWAPVIAIGLTLLAGFLIFVVLGKNPWLAYQAFFIDPLRDANGISEGLLRHPKCAAS